MSVVTAFAARHQRPDAMSAVERCDVKARRRLSSVAKVFLLTVSVAASVLVAGLVPSQAEPLQTMDQVGEALQRCWSPPGGVSNSSVTLSFSFKRDGTLIGRPQPRAIDVEGDEQAEQAFVDAAIAAVERCVPLSFADTLAQGIGGKVFSLKFASPSG